MKFGMPKLHSSNSNFIPENAKMLKPFTVKGFSDIYFFLELVERGNVETIPQN